MALANYVSNAVNLRDDSNVSKQAIVARVLKLSELFVCTTCEAPDKQGVYLIHLPPLLRYTIAC